MRRASDGSESDGVFGEYSEYYDLLYADKGYAAEADYVARVLRQCQPDARRLLELGSGTGTHALLLAERGYEIHGIERSPTMLLRAERSLGGRPGQAVAFSAGDIRHVRLGQRFDAVVALFHVMSYQRRNDDLADAFETARVHVRDGGVFLFDAWYGPAVLTERPSIREKRVERRGIVVNRRAEPRLLENENVVEVVYDIRVSDRNEGSIREFREQHDMRYLFAPEVDALAGGHGFRLEHAEEWMSGSPLSTSTWSACFVLRAE